MAEGILLGATEAKRRFIWTYQLLDLKSSVIDIAEILALFLFLLSDRTSQSANAYISLHCLGLYGEEVGRNKSSLRT